MLRQLGEHIQYEYKCMCDNAMCKCVCVMYAYDISH